MLLCGLLEFYWLDFASRGLCRLHFRGCVTAHESPFFGLLQGYSQNCALIANCRSRQTDPLSVMYFWTFLAQVLTARCLRRGPAALC
jgi:hypothetical protein